ncbi:M20 family metallopeptidase [Tengunoibacter tsumagoiensis]|uniref:Peptidase M20 n=1 Tax=Tengunoibacter tsumagoiensis TaxID=2014871 RepID=A0A401ZUN4_9CHLR|nr:M20 family metallopeptidase [Tengunoibacter tsumagoiensis]GCE10635.1 peptidase M20 [Tengunoibacter tsumagoiensis]
MQKHPGIEQAEKWMQPLLTDLEAIVNIDSGSYTKAGIDQVGRYLQRRFQALGFATSFDRQEDYGDHLVAVHQGQQEDGAHLLLIGHIDTVFPEGEAQRRPFSIVEYEGRKIAKGPGILDMKVGVLMGLYAVQMLIESGRTNYRSLTFICNSDEEIGSHSSHQLIQELARQSDAVMVLEPGRQTHTVVSARKGVGNFRVDVEGVAAHAGVDPQNGRNAILELAHHVIALQALNGTIPGVTLNVGLIQGGGRTNIVPDSAHCEIDVRVQDLAGVELIETALRRLTSKTFIPGTKVTLSGSIRTLPFEKSASSNRLVELAKEVGRDLQLTIEDVASGGASDANRTAPLGIPTIDGLGAGGSLAHNPDEYIELETLPIRLALLSGLLERIGSYYQSGKIL